MLWLELLLELILKKNTMSGKYGSENRTLYWI